MLLVIDDYNEMIYLQTLLKKIGFDVEGLNSAKKYVDASLGFNPQVLIGSALGKSVDVLSFGKDIRKTRGLPKIIALKMGSSAVSNDQLQSAGIDLLLDTPVNIKKLVLGMTSLTGVSEAGFLEKLANIQAKSEDVLSGDIVVMGSLDNLDVDHGERQAKKEMRSLMGLPEEDTDNTEDTEDEDQSEDPKVKRPSTSDTAENVFPTEAKIVLSDEEVAQREERYQEFIQKMEKPKPGSFIRDRILEFNKKIRSNPKPDDIDQIEDERKGFVRALFNKK